MKFKIKLAVYDQFEYKTVNIYSAYWGKEYPRLSEIMEVEHNFVMPADSEVINNQVSIIDNKMEVIQIESYGISSQARTKTPRAFGNYT